MGRPRREADTGSHDRAEVCWTLYKLGLLVRGSRIFEVAAASPPRALIELSSLAAQPNRSVSAAVSTERFAAALAELVAWCEANGREAWVQEARTWPTLRPLRHG